jgi:hypothetical protein
MAYLSIRFCGFVAVVLLSNGHPDQGRPALKSVGLQVIDAYIIVSRLRRQNYVKLGR